VTAARATVSPMLATLGDARDIDVDQGAGGWSFEMKWDGIRAIATVVGGTVRLATRNGIDVTATYPELASVASQVGGDAVLDGEIVALNTAGRPDFGRLQRRMKLTKKADVERAMRDVPIQYLVFDVLEAAGRSVVSESYDERRALLQKTVRSAGRIQVPPAFDGDLAAAVASSLKLGLEGVVAKRRDGAYSVGRRSRAWIKIKHHRTQEVVVGGWRPGKGRRESTIGSLLLGIPTPDGLLYVGRVGTGFGDRELDELTTTLSKLGRATTPFSDMPRPEASDAHWVTPTLVGEVEFAEWTPTDKLRQPSWRGWRPDKRPADVVREG
jgi:bifunctional non-homologous end joining protein LigD